MVRARGFFALSVLVFLQVLCPVGEVAARVVSYSPVTAANAVPAIQKRTNRYYLLVERDPRFPQSDPPSGNPVLHDSTGVEAPRVLLPESTGQPIASAAYREDADGTQQILLLTTARASPDQAPGVWRYLYSRDGGRSFLTLEPYLTTLGVAWDFSTPFRKGLADVGGPTARGTLAGVRVGTKETPFVFVASRPSGRVLFAVSETGELRPLSSISLSPSQLEIVGSDAEGRSFLVLTNDGQATAGNRRLLRVNLDGSSEELVELGASVAVAESFLSTSGGVYLQSNTGSSVNGVPVGFGVSYVTPGRVFPVLRPRGSGRILAIPTSAYDGAWIVESESSRPSVLYHHSASTGLVEQFRDVTGPDIEALHAGQSGRRVLIQVNRPRAGLVSQPFRDPALAVWEVGDGAPRRYDELFLVERQSKGFVSLDVDRVAEGASFVFDGGENPAPLGGGASGGGGGGGADVSQEYGVVKARLAQRLVIPAVARSYGAVGSYWRSDVHVRNPERSAIDVLLRYVPTDRRREPIETRLSLFPGEIRVLADVLNATFGVGEGSGALYLTPEGDAAIDATSRTYTEGILGTYGTAVPAFDLAAGANTGVPVYFSGAFQGDGFRTNLVAAGTSAGGGDVLAELMPPADEGSRSTAIRFGVPATGHAQVDGLSDLLGLRPWQTGALRLSPEAGEVVGAVIVIDNGTNDPTLFTPDLEASGMFPRTIPAIVHVDGANQARFRSDLFLTNPSNSPATVRLVARLWSRGGSSAAAVTLFPRETRVIRDVLSTAFGLSGVATLTISPAETFQISSPGVRVTSRTYAATPQGSYGFSMPPLGSFQRAQVGDVLEILGVTGGSGFRTNLAIVELSGWDEAPVQVEVLDERGNLVDGFEVRVAGGSGLQIDDLFAARGLRRSPGAALIRVRPLGGSIGAYVTLIDNGTNDPVYLGANLASRG